MLHLAQHSSALTAELLCTLACSCFYLLKIFMNPQLSVAVADVALFCFRGLTRLCHCGIHERPVPYKAVIYALILALIKAVISIGDIISAYISDRVCNALLQAQTSRQQLLHVSKLYYVVLWFRNCCCFLSSPTTSVVASFETLKGTFMANGSRKKISGEKKTNKINKKKLMIFFKIGNTLWW